MANVANVLFKKMSRAAFDAITTKDNGTFYRVTETGGGESFYQGANKLNNTADITAAIAALDASEFALATESSGVVTIKGIKEVDGVIAVGTDSTKDITLAKISTTGAAEDVSYSATIGSTTVTNVDDALDALTSQSAGGVASKTIYVTDDSAGQSDYAKVYKIWQGANAPDAETDPATLKGTINIPKDKVLQDASIVDITYDATEQKLYDGLVDVTALIKGSDTPTAADAGKYLKMEMQNVTDPLYVNLQTFVDVYTVESGATEVQLALNDHEFSGSIVDVAATKITYIAADAEHSVSRESVGAALTRLDGSDSTTGSVAKKVKDAIDALDADLDASGTAQHSGTFVVSGVTQTNGVLTDVDSVEVEAAGAAAALAATLSAVATSGDADDVAYDNTTSELTATDVQAAIDEIAGTAGSAVQSVTEGSTDGTISVDGTDVSVHGLGSASFADTTDFDPAGSAATAESNAEAYAAGLLTWVEVPDPEPEP